MTANNYLKLAVYRDVGGHSQVISLIFPFNDRSDASKVAALNEYVKARARLVDQQGFTCRGSIYATTKGLAFDVIGQIRRLNDKALS